MRPAMWWPRLIGALVLLVSAAVTTQTARAQTYYYYPNAGYYYSAPTMGYTYPAPAPAGISPYTAQPAPGIYYDPNVGYRRYPTGTPSAAPAPAGRLATTPTRSAGAPGTSPGRGGTVVYQIYNTYYVLPANNPTTTTTRINHGSAAPAWSSPNWSSDYGEWQAHNL